MREGPDEELKLTENAQPAIMANSMAVFRTMGVRLADVADFVAGHSLGEYSALCAAGSFDLATTAKLLKLRGQAMQQAVPVGQGAMAALLGADLALAQKSRRPPRRARSAPSPTTMTPLGRDLGPQGRDRPGDRDRQGHGREARSCPVSARSTAR
jgi:hypothetical protein